MVTVRRLFPVSVAVPLSCVLNSLLCPFVRSLCQFRPVYLLMMYIIISDTSLVKFRHLAEKVVRGLVYTIFVAIFFSILLQKKKKRHRWRCVPIIQSGHTACTVTDNKKKLKHHRLDYSTMKYLHKNPTRLTSSITRHGDAEANEKYPRDFSI